MSESIKTSAFAPYKSRNFSNPVILKLEDVWKVYQLGKVGVDALRGINLEIHRGSFVAIIGPSGCGKSTLLNIIGCLDVPDRGRVLLDGRDILKMSEDELAKIRGAKIGFVFQQFNLLPNLNALENVMLPMVFQGVLETERRERAKKLLEIVELEERILHKPAELSGGEQQRVAIARALANNPEIIVADEPTGNLDSLSGKKIMEILVRFHKTEKKTIVAVTHDSTIASYSEEIVNMKDGQIISNHLASRDILWDRKK